MTSTSHTRKDYHVLVDLETAREDLANFELSVCGRLRVYPRLPSETITLTTDAAADIYGDWTEVIPANLIPFVFTILGVIIETASASGIYVIQFADCAAGTLPGVNEEQGEVRHRATTPLPRSVETIGFGCREIAANRRVMARVMNDSGGDNITISVTIRRYLEVSMEVTKWPAFPW